MLMKLTTLFSLAAFSGLASAANLRNGPKDLSVNLGGLVGKNDEVPHAHRMLAMNGLFRDLEVSFDWDLMPEPDYPTIEFDGAGSGSEVRFLYNYTGTTSANKYIVHKLYRGDCKNAASTNAVVVTNSVNNQTAKEYLVDVDIKQETIASTLEYTDIDATSAMINFCIRVDYMYKDGSTEESINFHETNVTINVDLTANFTLTAINVDRIDADQVDEDAALNCEVTAYFCDGSNTNIGDPTFVQGDIMQVCVEIAPEDKALYHLSDVMDMDLEQLKADGINYETSTIVDNQLATGLSDKKCKNGICNIRHQLSSKFFAVRDPNNLDISGIAICAFGPLSSFTRRVGRAYKGEYDQKAQFLPLQNVDSIEDCKESCLGNLECLSFSAPANPTGTFSCQLVKGYPNDEDLIEDDSTVVYMRNDAEFYTA